MLPCLQFRFQFSLQSINNRIVRTFPTYPVSLSVSLLQYVNAKALLSSWYKPLLGGTALGSGSRATLRSHTSGPMQSQLVVKSRMGQASPLTSWFG